MADRTKSAKKRDAVSATLRPRVSLEDAVVAIKDVVEVVVAKRVEAGGQVPENDLAHHPEDANAPSSMYDLSQREEENKRCLAPLYPHPCRPLSLKMSLFSQIYPTLMETRRFCIREWDCQVRDV